MKKFCAFLITLILATPAFSETLTVAYFESAPYAFQDENGSLKGATVEFLENEIAPRMKIEIIWTKNSVPIARQLYELKKNKLDAAAIFAKNPEREKILSYPDSPYFKTYPVLAVLKSNKIQGIKQISDVLLFKKIGYCTQSFISPFMRDSRIQWDLLASSTCVPQNLKKLLVGRIDAQYQPDAPPILFYARKSQVEQNINIIPLPEEVALYMPFSKEAGGKYLSKYNQALKDAGGIKNYTSYLNKYIDVKKASQ